MPKNAWQVLLVAVVEICLLGSASQDPVAGLTFGIGLALPAAAAQDPTRGLLIRLELNYDGGPLSFAEHYFYRDGLVITRSVLGGNPRYWRGTLAPTELGKLKALLNVNHVGTIVAQDCEAFISLPDNIRFHGALTWFGKNGRQNHMTFRDGGDPICPDSLIILLPEIDDLDVTYTDEVTSVP
jgi:hypothetical protein